RGPRRLPAPHTPAAGPAHAAARRHRRATDPATPHPGHGRHRPDPGLRAVRRRHRRRLPPPRRRTGPLRHDLERRTARPRPGPPRRTPPRPGRDGRPDHRRDPRPRRRPLRRVRPLRRLGPRRRRRAAHGTAGQAARRRVRRRCAARHRAGRGTSTRPALAGGRPPRPHEGARRLRRRPRRDGPAHGPGGTPARHDPGPALPDRLRPAAAPAARRAARRRHRRRGRRHPGLRPRPPGLEAVRRPRRAGRDPRRRALLRHPPAARTRRRHRGADRRTPPARRPARGAPALMPPTTSALVTGGTSGLGLAVAERLMASGVVPVLLGRSAERGEVALKSLGGTAVFARGDVTSEAEVTAALDTAQRHGTLRAVVNCAGEPHAARVLGRSGPHSLEDFAQVVTNNLIGTFNVVRLAAARMAGNEPARGERGVLVNTASLAAYEGQAGQAAYAASKGGIVSMTLPLARELAGSLIRVVTVAPGFFTTPAAATLPPRPHGTGPRPGASAPLGRSGRVRRARRPRPRQPDDQRRDAPRRRRGTDVVRPAAPQHMTRQRPRQGKGTTMTGTTMTGSVDSTRVPTGVGIRSIGVCLPRHEVTNAQLVERFDTSDAWMRERLGITGRRIAGPDEFTSDLALGALEDACKRAG